MKITNVIFGYSLFVNKRRSDLLNDNIIEFDTVFSVADLSNVVNYEFMLPKDIYMEVHYHQSIVGADITKLVFKEKI